MADQQGHQTHECDILQSATVPRGPAIQGQKYGHVRRHFRYFKNKLKHDKNDTFQKKMKVDQYTGPFIDSV